MIYNEFRVMSIRIPMLTDPICSPQRPSLPWIMVLQAWWLVAVMATAQQVNIETMVPGGFIVLDAIAALGPNDVIVAGYRAEFAEQALVARITNGSPQWCRLLRDTSFFFNSSRIFHAHIVSNGDILLAGSESRAGLRMSWVARLAANGTLIWSTSVDAGEGIGEFHAACEAPDGSIYAVGRSGTGLQRNESVARLNAAGDVLWMRDLPYAGSQRATHALMQSDTLLVMGSTTLGAGANEIALFRFAPDGTLLELRTHGTPNNELPTELLSDGTGGYLMSYMVNTSQGAVVRLDGDLNPTGPPLILASVWDLNVSAGAIWDALMEEVVFLGRASNATDGFSMAIRVSLQSGAVLWDRSLPGTGFVTAVSSTGTEAELSCSANGFNANGSYPGHLVRLNLLSGEDVLGTPCEPPIGLQPITYLGSLVTMQHAVVSRVLLPDVIRGIPMQDLLLMASPCLSDALPIELLSWEGKAQPEGNLLTWTTAWEYKNAHFVIEHSPDNTAWNTLRVFNVSGSSVQPTHYQWLHSTLPPGLNYYRLRQVDTDGSETLSHVIAVDRSSMANRPLIHPNPAAPGELVTVSEPTVLMDLAGRVVAGPSGQFVAPQLPGIYVVRGRERTERLVVR